MCKKCGTYPHTSRTPIKVIADINGNLRFVIFVKIRLFLKSYFKKAIICYAMLFVPYISIDDTLSFFAPCPQQPSAVPSTRYFVVRMYKYRHNFELSCFQDFKYLQAKLARGNGANLRENYLRYFRPYFAVHSVKIIAFTIFFSN
jgi:hypothetical protein